MRAKKATILYRFFLETRRNLILTKSSRVRSKSAKSGDRSYSTKSGYVTNQKRNISPLSLARIEKIKSLTTSTDEELSIKVGFELSIQFV